MQRRKPIDEKYIWCFSSEKATADVGISKTWAVQVLKSKVPEVRAYTEPSPYVGHTTICIKSETKEDMRKALKCLDSYSLLWNPVKDSMKDVKKI
jgi:hypothetical protein